MKSNRERRDNIRLLTLCYIFNELSIRNPELGIDMSGFDINNPITYGRISCRCMPVDIDIVLTNGMNRNYITLMSARSDSHDPLGQNSFQLVDRKNKELEPELTMVALRVQAPVDVTSYVNLEIDELPNLTDFDYSCLVHDLKNALISFRYEMITIAKEEINKLDLELQKNNKILELCEKILSIG